MKNFEALKVLTQAELSKISEALIEIQALSQDEFDNLIARTKQMVSSPATRMYVPASASIEELIAAMGLSGAVLGGVTQDSRSLNDLAGLGAAVMSAEDPFNALSGATVNSRAGDSLEELCTLATGAGIGVDAALAALGFKKVNSVLNL